MKYIETSAVISPCGQYRYELKRAWDHDLDMCAFIMLNPSTADADQDDPTIRRVVGYAESWGFGGVVVLNLFAFRATSPKDMKSAVDPVGPENDCYLRNWCEQVPLTVAAWGNDGVHLHRSKNVLWMLRRGGVDVHCIHTTTKGQPQHPLYLSKNLEPIPYGCN